MISQVAAATLGTLPVALLFSATLARHLPMTADARYAIAFLAVIPTWLTSMCLAFLAGSHLSAWSWCVACCTLLAGVVFGLPGSP